MSSYSFLNSTVAVSYTHLDVYKRQGYEIASALGAKIACPDQEVYAMTGDGSFDMLHSCLLYTSSASPSPTNTKT